MAATASAATTARRRSAKARLLGGAVSREDGELLAHVLGAAIRTVWVVTVGSRIELERDDGEQMSLEISSVGGVSPESPDGRAVLGKSVGDEIEVEAPRGTWRAKVVSIGR